MNFFSLSDLPALILDGVRSFGNSNTHIRLLCNRAFEFTDLRKCFDLSMKIPVFLFTPQLLLV